MPQEDSETGLSKSELSVTEDNVAANYPLTISKFTDY